MAVKPLLPHQPVTTTGLRPSVELLEAMQIVQRESEVARWGKITGILSQQTDLQAALNGLQTAINGKANLIHTHVAADITDATAAGQAMLTAADAAAQTALLDVFTSTDKGLAPASGGGTTDFLRADGTFAAPAAFTATDDGYAPASGGGTVTYLRADGNWSNPRLTNAPVTKTADFTLADAEDWIINNKAGADCVVTLPAASGYSGRQVTLKTVVGFAVISAASDVVPLAGGAAGTGIVAAVAGSWATIVSDGTDWIIMAAA